MAVVTGSAARSVRVFACAGLVCGVAFGVPLNEPLVITNGDQLREISSSVANGTDYAGKTIELGCDIDLAADNLYTATSNVVYGTSTYPLHATQYVVNDAAPRWTPIGQGTAVDATTVRANGGVFAGTFDGKGHTIRGLYVGDGTATSANSNTVSGLFGVLRGTVKNVTVSGCITARMFAGGLVACLDGGTVSNCTNRVVVFADGGTTPNGRADDGEPAGGTVGGIVGLVKTGSKIIDCVNESPVSCANQQLGRQVGGIVGYIENKAVASVARCRNTGDVFSFIEVAGIVGRCDSFYATISACANAGTISMVESFAGGIVGWNDGPVIDCYNTGDVVVDNWCPSGCAASALGGIVGHANAAISNCYNTGRMSLCQNVDGVSHSAAYGAIAGAGSYNLEINCYTDDAQSCEDADYHTLVTAEVMRSPEFVLALNGGGTSFNRDMGNINDGFPILAWEGGAPPQFNVCQVAAYRGATTNLYNSLAEAFAAVQTNEIITLLDDVDIGNVCLDVSRPVPFILDFNGHRVTGSIDGGAILGLRADCRLAFMDSTGRNRGGMLNSAATGGCVDVPTGQLLITGGTFTAPESALLVENSVSTAIVTGGRFDGSVQAWGGTITISGGTFTKRPADDCIASGYVCYQSGAAEWTVAPAVRLTDVATANATVEVTVWGYALDADADGNYLVPSNRDVCVSYKADADYMFGLGQTSKTITFDTLTEDTSLEQCGLRPTAVEAWADVREIEVDTRERLVIGDPGELLPIAYSTNDWGAAEASVAVMVIAQSPQGEQITVAVDRENGYVAEWELVRGAYGKYTLYHALADHLTVEMAPVDIYYGAPRVLTIAAPEGGTLAVTTNGAAIASGARVLGYSLLSLAATPDANWQFEAWNITTNGAAVAGATALPAVVTFEMPNADATVTASFVVSDAYAAAATNELTVLYMDDLARLDEEIFPGEDPDEARELLDRLYAMGLVLIDKRRTPSGVDAALKAARADFKEAMDRYCPARAFGFVETVRSVVEGGSAIVRVSGGSLERATQVRLSATAGTGRYAAAYLDGRRVTLPLDLAWAKGDVSLREITFVTAADEKAAVDTAFTLQLGSAVGLGLLSGRELCTVTVRDAQGGATSVPYVRAIAWPANGGRVAGMGYLRSAKTKLTLTATANTWSGFAGWYAADAANPNAIDLTAPLAPTNPKYPNRLVVGAGTGLAEGTYYAYFTNVMDVASVVEPEPFDMTTGTPNPGVAGVTDWDGCGTYATCVGVKFALPVSFADASGKGRLVVTHLPYGLAYNAKSGRIEGVPIQAGSYEAKFVASNAAGKHTVTYRFEVAALPACAVGTFAGVICDDESRTGVGSVSFTAGKTGSLSAKVTRRLSGQRSFAVKGYDYVDENTLAVVMTNAFGEIFSATLVTTNGVFDSELVGTASGGTRKESLGWNGETNGVFVARRNAFATSDGNAAAQRIIRAYQGDYGETLFATNGLGKAGEKVGTAQYRVNAQGSVYVAARIDRTYDGLKPVAAKTFSGTVPGGFVYAAATGRGGAVAALRSGTSLWSTDVVFDYSDRSVSGTARGIRPNVEVKTDVVDTDELVGSGDDR